MSLSYNLKPVHDKTETLNGYFSIKLVFGRTNPLCGCIQILTAFGGGGGNWSFVSPAGSLQSRDLTRLRSLRSFNSLKTLHCNVFRTWLHAKVLICILLSFGGGGGNWSFVQACWLAAEPRPHSPSLAPVFQFPKNITL